MKDEGGLSAAPEVVPTTFPSLVADTDTIAYVATVSREIGRNERELEIWLALQQAGRQLAPEAARTIWVHPMFAELEQRREPDHQPCPAKCGRCSRCVHSQAWYARGRKPFAGVGQ